MKFTFTLLFLLLSWTCSFAQPITLPTYQQGQYENDTIYSYYGALPLTGIGRVDLAGSLAAGFITGVEFKIVVDSINQGGAPGPSAFRDSLGTMVPVNTGDTIGIPALFQLFAGEIGFYIIIEGTPQIAGESYLCDLGISFTGGNDWGMIISENSQNSCLVDPLNGLYENTVNRNIKIFPNPFNQTTTIEFENYSNKLHNFILYDLLGKEVRTINNISSNKLTVEKDNLPSGIYIFELKNKDGTVATGRLMVE